MHYIPYAIYQTQAYTSTPTQTNGKGPTKGPVLGSLDLAMGFWVWGSAG